VASETEINGTATDFARCKINGTTQQTGISDFFRKL
jgi:hypothetical protein